MLLSICKITASEDGEAGAAEVPLSGAVQNPRALPADELGLGWGSRALGSRGPPNTTEKAELFRADWDPLAAGGELPGICTRKGRTNSQHKSGAFAQGLFGAAHHCLRTGKEMGRCRCSHRGSLDHCDGPWLEGGRCTEQRLTATRPAENRRPVLLPSNELEVTFSSLRTGIFKTAN